jgi:hypothetical protein
MRGTLLITACIFFGAISSEAQTLGDAARKERVRRQELQSRIRISNDSVNYSIPVSAPESGSAKSEPTSIITSLLIEAPSVKEIHRPPRLSLINEEAPVVATPLPPPRDEKWWRSAFRETRDNLKRAEDQAISIQVALNEARLDQLQVTEASERSRLAVRIVQLTKDLASAQKDVTNARRNMSELEEDFSRSSAPYAWSR